MSASNLVKIVLRSGVRGGNRKGFGIQIDIYLNFGLLYIFDWQVLDMIQEQILICTTF